MDMHEAGAASAYEPVRSGSYGRRDSSNGDRRPILRAFDGRFVVDLNEKRVTWDGAPYHFGPVQTLMLAALAARAGRSLTTDHLLLAVYGPDVPNSGPEIVKLHIGKICNSFKDFGVPLMIASVFDNGYILVSAPN